MAKHKSRRLRPVYPQRRLSSGNLATDGLLSWLNTTEEVANTLVVRAIVRNMNEIDRIMGLKGYLTTPIKRFHSTTEEREYRRLTKSVAVLMTKICLLFERFPFRLQPKYPTTREWRFGLINTEKGENAYAPEFQCLLSIRDLAQQGRLTRVRECDICGQWFFAYCDSPNFRFCSDGCREKHWRRTPEGKHKRALFARKYRRKVKEAQETALKIAKASRKARK